MPEIFFELSKQRSPVRSLQFYRSGPFYDLSYAFYLQGKEYYQPDIFQNPIPDKHGSQYMV